jgi:hypothetical protein
MAAVVLVATLICGVSADTPSRRLLGEATHEWEYTGIFELEANKDYFMTLEKNAEGKYSQDEQQLLILPVDNSTNAGLDQALTIATKVWGKDKQHLDTDGTRPRSMGDTIQNTDHRGWAPCLLCQARS